MSNKSNRPSLWARVRNWTLNLKDDILYRLDDSRVHSGLLLLLFGAVLHFNCFGDPWVAVKWLALSAGVVKSLYAIEH